MSVVSDVPSTVGADTVTRLFAQGHADRVSGEYPVSETGLDDTEMTERDRSPSRRRAVIGGQVVQTESLGASRIFGDAVSQAGRSPSRRTWRSGSSGASGSQGNDGQ